MRICKQHIWIPLLGLLIGAILPHSDKLVIILAFSLFVIIPVLVLLFLYFIVIGIKGYRQKDRTLALKGRTGILTITLLLISPLASVFITDVYYKYKANNLIEQLEVYKVQKGEYPVQIEKAEGLDKASGLEYTYIPETKDYYLSYSSRGTVTTRYDSKYRAWRNYGWND